MAAALPALCGCAESHAGSAPCSKGADYVLPDGATFSGAFHTAALNWTEGRIEVSLDGAVVTTIDSPCLVNEIGIHKINF